MMSGHYEFQSEFARTYEAKGRVEGEAKGRVEGEAKGRAEALLDVAEALLDVLASRRLHVSDEARARILACTDSKQFAAWTRAAVSVASVDELF